MTQFEVTQFEATTMVRMAAPRDPAVTEYVRMRIDEILAKKEMTGGQIAAAVGCSPAYISTLSKTGVGGRTMDGFARFLRFRDADELRRTAYDWWMGQAAEQRSLAEEPAVKQAIRVLMDLHPQITDGQWRTILYRFKDEAFRGRDFEFWMHALSTEVKQDFFRAQQKKNEQLAKVAERRAERKKVEGNFRQGHILRAELAKEGAEVQNEARTEEPARKRARAPR